MYQEILHLPTSGRSTTEITTEINSIVIKSAYQQGLCNLFLKHTSASLIICENADLDVRVDLEKFMQRLVPDGDPRYSHTAEGKDDMPAHIRSILTQTSLMIPIRDHQLELGTWQGIFIWEHRFRNHQRSLVVTLI